MKSKPFSNIGYNLISAILILFGLLLLSSCGSGGDNLTASGGVGGTGVTIGEVSGYGSIFVNGVEFDTQRAQLQVEGVQVGSGDQVVRDHLPIGQQVVIHGDFSGQRNGTALRIDSFYRVLGPVQSITSIDSDSVEMTILGQTVYADGQTRVVGGALGTMVQGTILWVSGPVDADGAVHAGLITVETSTDTMGVKGQIDTLDTHQKNFRINGLTINYSAAQGSTGSLAEGQDVAVQGTFNGNELEASRVELFQTESIASADEFCIDGFLSGPNAQNQWHMGEYLVQLGSLTDFEGLSSEELTAGVRIKVRGRLQNRLLQADRVEAAAGVRLESSVVSVDPDNGTLTLAGMSAITIHANRLTRIHGMRNDLQQIEPGDYVRLNGFALDDHTVAASAIFGTGPNAQNNRFILQGPVTAVTGSGFAILSVAVDPSANADIAFWDPDLRSLTEEEFFGALQNGNSVRVSGHWEENQLIYESMTIIRQ